MTQNLRESFSSGATPQTCLFRIFERPWRQVGAYQPVHRNFVTFDQNVLTGGGWMLRL